MRPPKVRIFHVEDEWEDWRFLPHQLFDRLYESFGPERRVDLEMSEHYGTLNEPAAFTFAAFQSGSEEEPLFTYSFYVDAKQMAAAAPSPSDLIIVDVMSSDNYGDLKPSINQTLSLIESLSVPFERCRYFSAYPGEFPSGVNCSGFSKGEVEELITFLFDAMKKDLTLD